VVLLVAQAMLDLRSTSVPDGGASIAVALLLEEQTTLELTSASYGAASVVVVLLVEQAHSR
jgi:hypothetical protein